MDQIIGLKELREDVSKFERRVRRGGSFLVMRRNKPLFRIVSVDEDDDGKWETVIDFTKFRKGGIPAKELLERLKSLEK